MRRRRSWLSFALAASMAAVPATGARPRRTCAEPTRVVDNGGRDALALPARIETPRGSIRTAALQRPEVGAKSPSGHAVLPDPHLFATASESACGNEPAIPGPRRSPPAAAPRGPPRILPS